MNDGELNVSMNVETDSSVTDIIKLRETVIGATADIKAMTDVIHNHILKSTRDLTKMVQTGNKMGMERFKNEERLAQNKNTQLRRVATGTNRAATDWGIPSLDVATVESAIKAELAQINTSFKQAALRVAEANMKAVMRGIRVGEASAVTAATTRVQRQVADLIRREADAELIRAGKAENMFREGQLKANTTSSSIASREAAADRSRRIRAAYHSNTALVSADDSFRATGQNNRQMQAANPAYMDSYWNKLQEANRRQVQTHGNDYMVGLRDQQFSRGQNKFVREESDTNLQRARNVKSELAYEELKAQYLSKARLDLEARFKESNLYMKQLRGTQQALDARTAHAQAQVQSSITKSSPLNMDASRYFSDRGLDRKQAFFLNDNLRTATDNLYNIRQSHTMDMGAPDAMNAIQNRNASGLNRLKSSYGNAETTAIFDKAYADSIQRRAATLRDSDLQEAKIVSEARRVRISKEENLNAENIFLADQKRALGKAKDRINLAPDNVAAQIAATQRSSDNRARQDATPGLRQAQVVIANRRDAQTIRQAEVGQGRASMENTLDRLGSNGGADIMAIQTRILVGYQALSMAFNTMKNMATFVVQLDKEFKQFQAITASTNHEMTRLEKKLIDVSEATKFTALEVAQAATVMGQAGLSAREVGDSIESVTLLATAAGTDLNSAVDLVTSTLSIFNLQATQTADVANVMTAAINGSKLTIDKLSLGFQYAGNIAAQMGITYQELTGTLGALANSGIRSGSTLGTGLRQLLVDLQTPTEKFTKTLARMGLTQQDIDVKTRGLVAVMKSLKDAGFGVGEAFESFEVRAASSFTALANNLDVAISLQKQFILSSAAVEANATQMKSYANTLEKFKSVMGTIAYNTFKPLVEGLQQVTDFAAETFSILNKFPNLLSLIGIAASAVLTAGAFSLFGAVFSGIAKGLPVLSTFTGLMQGAPMLMDRFNVASGKSVSVVSALSMAFRAHPIVAFFTAITTGMLIFSTFIKKTEETKDKIDTLNGVINGIEGNIATARDEIGAIDEVISNLITRKAELNKDPMLREAKILEVIQQFKELGTTVDASKSSIDDLIDALNRIQDVDLGEQIGALQLNLANNALLISQLDRYKTEQQTSTGDAKNEISGRFRGPNSQKNLQSAADNVLAGQPDLPNIKNLLDMAFNYTSLPTDGTKFNGQLAGLKSSSALNDVEIIGLEDAIKVKRQNGQTSVAEEQRLALLKDQNDVMKNLIAVIEPMVATVLSINSTIEKSKNLTKETEYANAAKEARNVGANKYVQDVLGDQLGFTTAAEGRIQDKTTNTTQAEEIAKNLKEGFEIAMNDLEAESKRVYAILVSTGHSPDAAQRAVDNIFKTEELAALKNRINLGQESTGDAAKETRDLVNKAAVKKNQDKLKAQAERLSKTYTLDAADRNGKIILSILADRKAMQDALFADEIKAAHGDEKILEPIRGRMAEADEEHAILVRDYADQVIDQQTKIQEEIYKQTDEALSQDISDLTSKIKELGQKIRDSRPGAMLDDLISQYNTFLEQLHGLNSTQQANGLRDSFSSQGMVMGKGLSEKSGQAMQFFMGKGYSQAQSQGLVGNLMAESRLNTKAIGDGGKAFGIAQWHPDRQAGLARLAKQLGTSVEDFFTQLEFVAQELNTTEKRAGDRLKAAKTVHEATKAGADYERPLGHNWTNSGGSHNFEGRYKYALAMGGDFGTDQKDERELATDRDEAVTFSKMESLKSTTKASVRDGNKQIAGLSASAKASSDPEAILSISRQISTIFDQIVKEQLDLFKAENKDALSKGSADALDELDSLNSGLETERATKLQSVLDQYDRAAKERINKPVEDAKKVLEEAQRPGNVSKFSNKQINAMQLDIISKEQEAQTKLQILAEGQLVIIREKLADATKRSGDNSAESISWKEAETEATLKLRDAEEALTAQRAVQADPGTDHEDAFNSGVEGFKQRSGFFGEDRELLSQAKQMESVWGETLDGLASGFEALFMNISNGSMTAGQAMRAFALTTIQMFMQMIAKALAYQVILQMLKSMEGMGGTIGKVASALFTIPGAATGELIPKRAAVGEIVTGGIPNRDSVLRLVEPGEMILRQSAVAAIGSDNLLNINAMGNRKLSQTAPEAMGKSGQGTVNVWVVSPDGVPPLGADDIVATIANNIERKGPIRNLIKQVQMGAA